MSLMSDDIPGSLRLSVLWVLHSILVSEVIVSYMISVLSSDSGSSVSGHSEVQFSQEEMAEAIKIKEEIQQIGMDLQRQEGMQWCW